MTSLSLPRLALPLVFLLAPSPTIAAAPQRIPLEPSTSVEIPFQAHPEVRIGDRLYFTAEDPLYGRELWLTDGGLAGTRRLTDLCPGSCSPSFELVPSGDRLYLLRHEDAFRSLFEIAGEEVKLVVRFPGFVKQAVGAGGEVYLDVIRPAGEFLPHAEVIYRSNGEPGDLHISEVICEQAYGSRCDYTRLETMDGDLYYHKDGYLTRLAPDSEPLKVIPLYRSRLVAPLPGGRFLFFGCQEEDCWIYNSDGTTAGTFKVVADHPRSLVGFEFASWNGFVYWVSEDGKLVRSDGSAGGIWVVADSADRLIATTPSHLFYIRLGATSRDLRLRALSSGGSDVELLSFDRFRPDLVGTLGDLVFLAYNDQSLHVSDGTQAGTRLLDDLVSSEGAGLALGSRFYAAVRHRAAPSSQDAMWRFDAAGVGQPFPTRNVPLGDCALPFGMAGDLIASLPFAEPSQLWRVDPQSFAAGPIAGSDGLEPLVAAGERLLAGERSYPRPYYGITPAGVEPLAIDPNSDIAASPEGKFYWGEANPGQKLWEGDGTAAGTRELADFSPGWTQIPCSRHCRPLHPSSLHVEGDDIYLVADSEPAAGPYAAPAIWVHHRGSGQRTRLKTFDRVSEAYEIRFFPVAGKLVFELDSPPEDRGLWLTDGTAAGTRKVFTPPAEFFHFDLLAAVGPQLFFADSGNQSRLWVSDLTQSGTYVLLDRDDLTLDSSEVAAAGDHFFFVATTYDLGRELWTSDGTPAGTRALDLRSGPLGSQPSSLLEVGGRLVLAADRGSDGHELYESDGTLTGTVLLADIAPGSAPSSPTALLAAGERLFFSADDGGGRGLWAFDLPTPSRSGCPADQLCLLGGRFEVQVSVQGAAPVQGRRVLESEESGVFSFFSPSNWELLVKVLDGCAINDRFWIYSAAATDRPFTITVKDAATGQQRTYQQPGGAAHPALDADAFATCAAAAPPAAHGAILPVAAAAPRGGDGGDAFCFGAGGRFRATASWQTTSAGGFGHASPYGSADSGLFTFFSPSNWELMVKVLDGCAINGRQWVYVAGSTDVGWQLTVEDLVTGEVRRYRNENGSAGAAITDAEAFASCP